MAFRVRFTRIVLQYSEFSALDNNWFGSILKKPSDYGCFRDYFYYLRLYMPEILGLHHLMIKSRAVEIIYLFYPVRYI